MSEKIELEFGLARTAFLLLPTQLTRNEAERIKRVIDATVDWSREALVSKPLPVPPR